MKAQETPVQKIASTGIPVYLHGFSAIDSYLEKTSGVSVYAACSAGLTDLAFLFQELRYPGAAFADAAVDSNGKTWYFRCEDSAQTFVSFDFLNFYQDCATHHYYDPKGIYPILRDIRKGDGKLWQYLPGNNIPSYHALFDMAKILAKYYPQTRTREIQKIAACFSELNETASPGIEEQRLLLMELLEAQNPAAGFELLEKCGFVNTHWPQLAKLNSVDHSKEFHPEGNVWKHTMETLRYRKPGGSKIGFDIRLSLGLLLHDCGKPLSNSAGSMRFCGHAELGAYQARRFLLRLGFDLSLVNDVCFLVRNHMLPAALSRLPLSRTGELMDSPLFPLLMELYRCDESSSFKGLDDYYKNSAAYRAYLKKRKNPYR